jgi:hypothetical protein
MFMLMIYSQCSLVPAGILEALNLLMHQGQCKCKRAQSHDLISSPDFERLFMLHALIRSG